MGWFEATLHSPTFWVAVSFAIFVGIVLYMKVPASVAKSLDARAGKISAELDEARTLREEAQALLAQYQRKQRDIAKEAEDMVALSKEEAEIFAKEASAGLDELIERRTKSAEDKIVQAEANAVKEVRAAAVEVAVNAAEKVIRLHMEKSGKDGFVDSAIEDLDKRLH